VELDEQKISPVCGEASTSFKRFEQRSARVRRQQFDCVVLFSNLQPCTTWRCDHDMLRVGPLHRQFPNMAFRTLRHMLAEAVAPRNPPVCSATIGTTRRIFVPVHCDFEEFCRQKTSASTGTSPSTQNRALRFLTTRTSTPISRFSSSAGSWIRACVLLAKKLKISLALSTKIVDKQEPKR